MAKNYRKARHIMLDIETLDTKPTAAVLSIGAVGFRFLDDGSTTTFTSLVAFPSLREQLVVHGRTIDAETQGWWRKQEEAAKDSVLVLEEATVGAAMQRLRDMLADEAPDYVWAQGASFDFPILMSLAREVNVDLWPFWIERDTRTLFGMPDTPPDRKQIAQDINATAHDALEDCRIQIEAMRQVLFTS